MLPLWTLRRNLKFLQKPDFRYYCRKPAPSNLARLPVKQEGVASEQQVSKVTKAKTQKRRGKLKLDLIEVGASSVAEGRAKATKITKRTLKDAMARLQSAIQSSRFSFLETRTDHTTQIQNENIHVDHSKNADSGVDEHVRQLIVSDEAQSSISNEVPLIPSKYRMPPIFSQYATYDDLDKDLADKTSKKNTGKKKNTKKIDKVGPLSVAERHAKTTKINKRTLKEAMPRLQPAIQTPLINFVTTPSVNEILDKIQKLDLANTGQANNISPKHHNTQIESHEHHTTQIENNNIFAGHSTNTESAVDEHVWQLIVSDEAQSSISNEVPLIPSKYRMPPIFPQDATYDDLDKNLADKTSKKNTEKKKSAQKINKEKDVTAEKSAMSTAVKKRKSKSEENAAALKKHTEALHLENKKLMFNSKLEAYLSACVTAGIYIEAYRTLSHYRRYKSNLLSSVTAYDIVMRGLYLNGQYALVSGVNSWLLKSDLTPSACTHALHIASLHKMSLKSLGVKSKSKSRKVSSSSNASNISGAGKSNAECFTSVLNNASSDSVGSAKAYVQECSEEKINAVLGQISEQGRSMDWLFSEANFVGSLYEDTLAGVQRVLPHYTPTPADAHCTPGYVCPLLVDANDNMDYTTCLNTKEDPCTKLGAASAYVPSPEAFEEQLAMEMAGRVSISSVHTTVQNAYYKNKLKIWQERWRRSLTDAYCTAVENELRPQFSDYGPKKRMGLYPYLAVFTPQELVDIMMLEIQVLGEGSEGNSPTINCLYRRLGNNVFNAFTIKYIKNIGLLDKFRRVYADYVKIYAASFERGFNPRVALEQVTQLHPSGPRLTHQPPDWPMSVRQELGMFLYGLISKNVFVWTPLDTEERKYRALDELIRMTQYKNTLEVRPHAMYSTLHKETRDLSFSHCELPMFSPPRPWVGPLSGGYFLQSSCMIRHPPDSPNFNDKFQATSVEQSRPCLDSLNTLACTPWRVNGPMLDIITEVFNTNSGANLDVPPHHSTLKPPSDLMPNSSLQDRALHKSALAEYTKNKNEMYSLWCTALYKLSIANHFRDRIFWFPHNFDFRGRAYPCPAHFSHFDSDVFRSLLIFAEPKPLGKRGLQWLKTHLINLTGIKKHDSLETRLQYSESVLPKIFDSAERPLTGNRWWTTSDEPWQTLAACKELHAALHSPDPEAYLSRLPIHQDGSCNGLQHYAALGRDVEGAHSVNLAPNPVPQDVYTEVATLVEKIRAKDAANPNSVHHDTACTLEGCIKRSVVKQTVMTTVYGVTKYGAILQIEKQLKELGKFPLGKRKEAAAYLSGATFRSLEMMFTSTKEIQDWFTDCASLISKVCRESVEWATPLGLLITQPYYKPRSKAKALESIGRMPSSYAEVFHTPNSLKQRNAFPPNFIHSLDASHMMLTALHCHRHQLTFASVHDCYWTHACNVDTMSKICRDQFVALHSQPILSDLSKFMCERYGFTDDQFAHNGSAKDASLLRVNKTLKAVPKLGDFDIELVKKSTFFFS